ncbi:hypothetical protein BH11PSE14_BH11PSE14_19670 [soil metagenome]
MFLPQLGRRATHVGTRDATRRTAGRAARIATLLFGLLPLAACAGGERLVDIQVVDVDQGELLPAIGHRGRDYIAGAPGHRFSVSLRNQTGERVLAVLSVDGVNAVSGQTASASQAGYVLEPWQQVEIRGWRKSYSDIAEFYFTDLPDSYAARTGRPDNVGVIGVAAFRERRPVPVPYAQPDVYSPPYPASPAMAERESAKASAGSAAADAGGAYNRRSDSAPAEARAQQLGTGHGERRYDPVAQTAFERDSSRPNQVLAIYYDSLDALASRGIISPRRYASQPQAFPLGFVPDP